MGYGNGRITAPVNSDDVNATINEPSHDWTALCRSSRINKVALYRPRYCTVNPGLYLGNNGDSDGFKWIATQNGQIPTGLISEWGCPRYGVWVPKYNISSTASSLWNALFTACRRAWFIKEPEGDSFDIIDHFAGYYHNARATKPASVSVSPNGSSGNRVVVSFTTPSPDNATMSISNLFGTASSASTRWYFGAVVFRGTNKEGWTTSDTMLVGGSTTPISNTSQTTAEVMINDTSASQSAEYVYRVIPFVCNKSGLTSAKLVDTTFYGIGIISDYVGWIEVKSGAVQGVEVRVNYFNWKDANNGNYYPIPGASLSGGTRLASPITTGKAILIAYSETANLGTGKTLWDKYTRVDFTFDVYNNDTGTSSDRVYTWASNGSSMGNSAMRKDPNHNGSVADRMLFYIADDSMITWPNEVYLAYADFYWTDDLGYQRVDHVDAAYIGDAS